MGENILQMELALEPVLLKISLRKVFQFIREVIGPFRPKLRQE